MNHLKVKDFDLQATMESGQLFPFTYENNVYRFLQRDKWISVKQENDILYYTGCDETYIRHFFRLDETDAQEALAKEKELRFAVKACRGLKIMRQDPYQCTISFLCSQNSNIPRIQQNIKGIVHTFGKGKFPKPGTIQDKEKLKTLRLGYRESYVLGTDAQVNDDYFAHIKTLPYDEAKEELCKLPGIGPKVADCILLFSLEKTEAFPVDVWIKRAMEELYFDNIPQKEETITSFGRHYFGSDAGYAQQYLYHARRTLKE